MLKIVIDATPIAPQPSGVGFHLLSSIAALDRLKSSENFQLGLVYQPGFKNWLRGNLEFPQCLQKYSPCYQLPLPVRISNIFLDRFPHLLPLFFEPILEQPDIFHGTNYTVYPFKNSRKVINIYDLAFLKYSQYVNSTVKQYQKRVKKCLQWSDLIITSAESTKQEIIEYLEIEPQKISVTPLASRYSNFKDINTLNKTIKEPFQTLLSQPYILFVSTIEPRKNINNLIAAFNHLKQTEKIQHNLILIGKKGWQYQPIFTAIAASPWQNCIHHLGYLSDELVALFYQRSDVFVYPSYYEGFGLPVLEAMTLGAPVVTSNTSSLPEVAGDAALLIDPNQPIEIADAILKIITDTKLRQNLIKKGKVRAQQYSWSKTALLTLKAYKSIL